MIMHCYTLRLMIKGGNDMSHKSVESWISEFVLAGEISSCDGDEREAVMA